MWMLRLVPGAQTLMLFVIVIGTHSQLIAMPAVSGAEGESRLFTYDRSAPFDLKEESAKQQDGITIRDINYAAYDPRHGRVWAYLLNPAGRGPFAGVLFFHWLGQVKSDRTEFLDEAQALAKQGAVALLIQGYFPWLEEPKEAPADLPNINST